MSSASPVTAPTSEKIKVVKSQFMYKLNYYSDIISNLISEPTFSVGQMNHNNNIPDTV